MMTSNTWQNPFNSIKNIPNAKTLMQKWQNKAMRSSVAGTSIRVPIILRTQRKETHRVDVFSRGVRDHLKAIVQEFPDFSEIHPFYLETADILFSIDDIKKTLGSLYSAQGTIMKIRGEHIGRIWRGQTAVYIKKERRAAIGRINSFIKKLDRRLVFLEKVRNELRRLPGLNPSFPSIVAAGYPNVGKSTFVKTVTAVPLQIASYPFTTKEVAIGHREIGEERIPIQVVDTPGVLDRSLDDLKPIELRALAAIRHLATILLFIIDPTETCGFILDKQLSLLEQIREILSETPIICLLNKADLMSKTEQKTAKERVFLRASGVEILIGSAMDSEFSHEILLRCIQKKEVVDLLMKNIHDSTPRFF
ncbi:MAG: NOG1 family protein [Promethearchaeota archaeon]